MSRKQKSLNQQYKKRLLGFHSSFIEPDEKQESSSSNRNRQQEHWQRWGEGFQLPEKVQAPKEIKDSAEKSRAEPQNTNSNSEAKPGAQFARKWIQPEELMKSSATSPNTHQNRKSGSLVSSSRVPGKLNEPVSLPADDAEDQDQNSICWNSSDSESEDVQKRKQVQRPPAKTCKSNTSATAKTTKLRRKPVSTKAHGPIPEAWRQGFSGVDEEKKANDSENEIDLSESDTEEAQEKKKEEAQPPPVKKCRRNASAPRTMTTKTKSRSLRRKSPASAQSTAPVAWRPNGSDDDDANQPEDEIAFSESEEEEECTLCEEKGEADHLAGSNSPVLHIECTGSPDRSAAIPEENDPFAITDPEDEGSINFEDNSVTSDRVHSQSLGSQLSSASGVGTPSISCESSQGTTGDSDISPGQAGLRASEWARQMKLETTPSKQPPKTPPNHADSGKKRKKFCKGGLAEQMWRIVHREKSARSMWQHQHKNTGSSQGSNNRSMQVRVNSVSTVYSFTLAKCTITHSHSSSLSSSSSSSSSLPQCFVLFSAQSSKHKDSLQCGVSIHIYPPWQQVDTKAGRTVLCSRYHVGHHHASSSVDQQGQQQPEWSHLHHHHHHHHPHLGSDHHEDCDLLTSSPLGCRARWMCPCSDDSSVPAQRCPAHLFPFLMSSVPQPITGTHPTTEKRKSSGRTLHTVTCAERAAPRRTLTFCTMLESIEKAPAGDRLLPAFEATVLRVFRERVDNSFCRSSLLVEDSQGTVGVITQEGNGGGGDGDKHGGVGDKHGGYCDSHGGGGASPLSHLEGQLCSLTCLTVVQRTTADRDPALFSAVNAAWAQRTRPSTSQTASQDSNPDHGENSHSQQEAVIVPVPGFCYLLDVDRGAVGMLGEGEHWITPSTTTTTHPNTTTTTTPPPLRMTTLAHALENGSDSSSRVSVLARLLYVTGGGGGGEERGGDHEPWTVIDHRWSVSPALLYLTDHTLPRAAVQQAASYCTTVTDASEHIAPCYVTVEVRQDCVTSDICWDQGGFRNMTPPPHLVLLRDIWCVNGRWIADKYSTVVSTKTSGGNGDTFRPRIDSAVYSAVSQCGVTLPALCVSTLTPSLVSVEGTVVSVDEKSSFSWEECDACGSDQLASRPGSQSLTCLKCRKLVTSPVPRMKMDVTVKSHTDPSVTASVSLQQATIEQLLPAEEEEEGYDVDCVMNKAVGPLHCMVTSCQTDAPFFTALQICT